MFSRSELPVEVATVDTTLNDTAKEEEEKEPIEKNLEKISTGHEAEEQQRSDSSKIFFILIVLG